MKLSLEVNLLLSPKFLHQHDRFVAPLAAFFLAHPGRVEVARIIATDADYEQKPSLAEKIERSKLLGKNYGMARRQHKGAGAKLHVPHPRRQVSHKDNGVEGRPRGSDPVADPHRVDVPALAIVDKLEKTVRRFPIQRTVTQTDPDADFHGHRTTTV